MLVNRDVGLGVDFMMLLAYVYVFVVEGYRLLL